MNRAVEDQPSPAGLLLQRAREAGGAWAVAKLPTRLRWLRTFRHRIVESVDAIVDAICADAGKSRAEALTTDLLPTLEIIRHSETIAPRVLAPERRGGSLLFAGTKAHVEYLPYGVVLIIGPWNNPFQLVVLPLVSALLGGNAVIVKPSERTPQTAAVLRRVLAEAKTPEMLAQIVEGGPDAAARLLECGPDFVFFTGSVDGGRQVYRAAAGQLAPCVMELGGKDPMLVFDDADLDRAAHGAVYGAFAHHGQHCISVERLYVQRSVYERFAKAVAEGASRLRLGVDLGKLPQDTEARVRRQIDDALAAGARLMTPRTDGRPDLPAVIADVRPDMALMREETFGPALPIMPFDDEQQALALAADSDFALNAGIWTGAPSRGARLASHLRCGNVFVNNVLTNAGHPALPFGGARQSGFGRYHGPEGLLTFVQPKSVLIQKHAARREFNWLPYDNLPELTAELIRLRYGHMPRLQRWRRWLSFGRNARKRLDYLARIKLWQREPDAGEANE